ncbi:MAG: SRPBCC family protein [Acidobacteriota bacterium]
MYVLSRSQRVEAPLGPVFSFFSDPGNLARITPPWLRFRIHGTPPGRIEPGTRIEYRIRWTVLTLSWVTRITAFTPPSGFQDLQERGPYRTWLHTHSFEADGTGVVIRDRVEYSLPFGPIGRIAHALFVRRQLEGIFEFRRRAVEEIFAAAA